MVEHKSDSLLLERFIAGEAEAFNELVRRYHAYVLNIVYSLLGDSRHADDIAQEVFIKAYRNAASFKGEAKFSTWLYRITVNTAYNHLKAGRRYFSLEEAPQEAVTSGVAAEAVHDKERQSLVREAIAKLPFKYRTVLVLKEMEGLSYADIAMTLKCSIGTVESRLFRARKLLKKILEPLFMKEGGI